MRSPFPGMDPYLEYPAFWRDFHHHFISVWSEVVTDHLPDSYEARIDERVVLGQFDPDFTNTILSDVALSKGARSGRAAQSASAVAVLEAEVIPQAYVEDFREAYIEIRHRPDQSLVAVLELLSPSNKVGEGFYDYEAKRGTILKQRVHLFELDLLHVGNPPALLRPLPESDYRALFTSAENPEFCSVYTFSMRERLPALPIPLRAPDPDISVDLQEVFELTYERGRYQRSVRYDRPIGGEFSEADATWIYSQIESRKS